MTLSGNIVLEMGNLLPQAPYYMLNPGFLPSHIPELGPEDADP